jgi:hypothetical protein
MSYAARTTVTPERSRMELEQILARYGAAAFGYGYEEGRAVVTFKAHERIVRFTITVPDATVGDWATAQLEVAYSTGEMPSLLPGVRRELTA